MVYNDRKSYDGFSILIPENNQFKLHLKESLLSKRYTPESSVKWGHLAYLDPNPTNTISPNNPMGSSSTL